MRHTIAITTLLALCACGPKSKFQDYTTPERAARSYIEAGRVGDDGAMRRSVVAADLDGVIGRAREAGVAAMVTIGTGIPDGEAAAEVAARFGQVGAGLAGGQDQQENSNGYYVFHGSSLLDKRCSLDRVSTTTGPGR